VALVQIDPGQAEKVVPLLVTDLKAPDEKLARDAVPALARLGPVARPAAAALAASLRERRLDGAEALALRAIGAGAAETLGSLLKDTNVDLRRLAVIVLAQLGPAARDAVPSLIGALTDADSGVRAGAAHAIKEIGAGAGSAVPALVANLQVYQAEVRRSATLALGHIGPAARPACPLLLECLLDPDEEVRYAAALSLGRIDPHYTEAAPALRDALRDASPKVRLAAIDSLSHIDRAAVKECVPILIALSSKPEDLDVRFRAVDGLCELAPEEARQAVPWLLVELTDADPANALYAARLLARIDPGWIPDLALVLAAALRTPLPDGRRAILQTLGEFGARAREAVPSIEHLLQDGAPGVRTDAIEALRTIDPRRAKRLGLG
jgi:HEAT repeat protein